jgi:TPR repeat protein
MAPVANVIYFTYGLPSPYTAERIVLKLSLLSERDDFSVSLKQAFYEAHMNNSSWFAIAISTLVATTLIGCSEKAPSLPTPEKNTPQSNASDSKSDARAALIKSLEARAAQSDGDAQLSLAKVLLDGSETPPNYERAKGLLISASEKKLPEASMGLYLLRKTKVINDEQLPSAEILRETALATSDPFVISFLFSVYSSSTTPSKSLLELADSGSPLASAGLAKYYGVMAFDSYTCSFSAQMSKKRGIKHQPSDDCIRAEQHPESFQMAITYAAKLVDAKEVDTEKFRYWIQTLKRAYASKPSERTDAPLLQMYFAHVASKVDPYSEKIAYALSFVGRNLKDGRGGPANPTQAAKFLTRAAELGDATAQNAMGELHRMGRGVPKDFEVAARYFAQSAQQADSEGAKNMGLAYAKGHGVELNRVQAYLWFSISSLGTLSQKMVDANLESLAELGDPAALRDTIAIAMSADEIAAAQRLVREWRPSYQVGPPTAIASSKTETRSDAGIAVQASDVKRKVATGTAFIVGKTGHAITNHHVIDGCKEVRTEGRDGVVKLITSDAVNDIALLQVPGTVNATAAINADPAKLRQGEDIVVFGFPLNAVLSSGGNLTPGVVSALTGLGNNTNQIQITAPIQPGSSGSPVLNKKGEVVGVVSMKLSDSKMAKATGQIGQNVNFAVSGQTLKSFLDTHKVDYSKGGFMSFDKSTADLADEAKKWTTVVECWK